MRIECIGHYVCDHFDHAGHHHDLVVATVVVRENVDVCVNDWWKMMMMTMMMWFDPVDRFDHWHCYYRYGTCFVFCCAFDFLRGARFTETVEFFSKTFGEIA